MKEKVDITALRMQMMQSIEQMNNLEYNPKKEAELNFEIEKGKALNDIYREFIALAIAEVKYRDIELKREVIQARGELLENAPKKIESSFFS